MANVLDKLRQLVEDQRETGYDIAAAICEEAADHIEDLADKLTAAEDERDDLSRRLQAIEEQLQVLGTAAKYIQFAALDLREPVPVLEVRR